MHGPVTAATLTDAVEQFVRKQNLNGGRGWPGASASLGGRFLGSTIG